MLEFRQVTKKIKNTQILKDITLTINDGELVAFIGPSGCGKTTTLKMVNRLLHPTSGTILLNGKDIQKEEVIRLRRNIGYVIQQTGLFPHMTVKENIELIEQMEHIPADRRRERTIELMEMAGLDYKEFAHRYPGELSGGQQQRVGVARALALDPDIILMDEPFSALDPVTRTSLQEQLLMIQDEMKKTIIFVTHDMDEAIKLADRICLMNDGKVIQYDTPENILKNPGDKFVENFVGRNRIWDSPELINAEDIMIHNVIICRPGTSLVRAYEYMRQNKVDTLMVTDHKRYLKGYVSAYMIREMKNQPEVLVGDIMSEPPAVIHTSDTLVDVMREVRKTNFYNAPVVDEQGVLAGLITRSSLVTTFSRQFEEEGETE